MSKEALSHMAAPAKDKDKLHILSGECPNADCVKTLYFPAHEASIECSGCGQRHSQGSLNELKSASDQVTGTWEFVERLLGNMGKTKQQPQGQVEETKVHGLTNQQCTILSPLLTHYGMDKVSGRAKLLTEMGRPPVFDCGQLCDRAFLIDSIHLNVAGYGLDCSGSLDYLKDTLALIKVLNDNEDRLVPLHADGDGHCLVHAVSRALVGWQMFWHPLRANLGQHFRDNLDKYQMQFDDFIEPSEWPLIISECDPDFVPSGAEPTGLRNIHIFGLANVLKRPIILLDSIAGIQSSGDYSAVFLPYFSEPSVCKSRAGVLNPPLCIAWSSSGRNHFIPLVGVKGKKCPVISRTFIQRAWGVDNGAINQYLDFDEQGNCLIGGEKQLQTPYIQRLVTAMDHVFLQQYSVSARLVADVYLHIFKPHGLVLGHDMYLIDKTVGYVKEEKLFSCLSCHHLALPRHIEPGKCVKGGELYDLAVECHTNLKDQQRYSFPLHGIVATYNVEQDVIEPDMALLRPLPCFQCGEAEFRTVQADYTVNYRDGDQTQTKSTKSHTGYKAFYGGHEYDTVPKRVVTQLEWAGKVIKELVCWFEGEEDPQLNSNVYEIAENLVQKHFPGEWGSERLVQRLVEQILFQVKMPEAPVEKPKAIDETDESQDMDIDEAAWSSTRASKAILTGFHTKSIHKEELGKSETERRVRRRTEENADRHHRRLSDRSKAQLRRSTEKQTSEMSSTSPLNESGAKISPSHPGASCSAPAPTCSLPPVNKRIKLSTSDGRNVTLDLPADCSYTELQSLIATVVQVPAERQRIRFGFPPRPLKAPTDASSDYKVPIQPGDKIMLDIIASKPSGPTSSHTVHTAGVSTVPKEEGPPLGGHENPDTQALLKSLMEHPLMNTETDPLDHALSTLALQATLQQQDLWSHVQSLPHLFIKDGLFYRQVERDMGLAEGKHCTLPLLPGKLFVYSHHDNRLELCLEPYGHFPVAQDIESKAQSLLPVRKCGVSSTHNNNKAFLGQGHSLRPPITGLDTRMPSDLPVIPHRHEARPALTFSDPTLHQESIEEEDEEEDESMHAKVMIEEDTASKLTSHILSAADRLLHHGPHTASHSGPMTSSHSETLAPDSRLVRRGPGYSMLSPIPENNSNMRMEILQQLVSHIEQAVETLEDEEDAFSRQIDANPTEPSIPNYDKRQNNQGDIETSGTSVAMGTDVYSDKSNKFVAMDTEDDIAIAVSEFPKSIRSRSAINPGHSTTNASLSKDSKSSSVDSSFSYSESSMVTKGNHRAANACRNSLHSKDQTESLDTEHLKGSSVMDVSDDAMSVSVGPTSDNVMNSDSFASGRGDSERSKSISKMSKLDDQCFQSPHQSISKTFGSSFMQKYSASSVDQTCLGESSSKTQSHKDAIHNKDAISASKDVVHVIDAIPSSKDTMGVKDAIPVSKDTMYVKDAIPASIDPVASVSHNDISVRLSEGNSTLSESVRAGGENVSTADSFEDENVMDL